MFFTQQIIFHKNTKMSPFRDHFICRLHYIFYTRSSKRISYILKFSPRLHYSTRIRSILFQIKNKGSYSIILFYMKTIGLCSDHAGFELKEYVRGWLEAKGWPYKDYGTYSTESCDYPDFAHQLAQAVEAGECYPGIAICGSGNGINMTLNKHQGIRAAL